MRLSRTEKHLRCMTIDGDLEQRQRYQIIARHALRSAVSNRYREFLGNLDVKDFQKSIHVDMQLYVVHLS